MNDYTGELLRQARADAKASGVTIPKLSVTHTQMAMNRWYYVEGSGAGMIFTGTACDASEAKAKAIRCLIEDCA